MRFDPQSNQIVSGELASTTPVADQDGSRWALKCFLACVAMVLAVAGFVWLAVPTAPESLVDMVGPLVGQPEPQAFDADGTLPAVEVASSEPAPESESESEPDSSAAAAVMPPSLVDEHWSRQRSAALSREATREGRAHLGMGRYQEALPCLKRAVKLDPTSSDAKYYLGLTYVRLGREQLAKQQTQALRDLDPSLATMLANLTG